VDRLVGWLATGPAHAYTQTKALLTREQDMSLPAAVELEAVTQALLMTSKDHAEFHADFAVGRDRAGRAAESNVASTAAVMMRSPR
jgi:enoyl-CoA hydratase/carnithine racemase